MEPTVMRITTFVFSILFVFSFVNLANCQTTNSNCGTNGTCDVNAVCNKISGQTYACQCDTGYLGDGVSYCYFDINGQTGKSPCSFPNIRCSNGSCIGQSKIRDGIKHCGKGEDESCYVTTTNNYSSQIRCDKSCILKTQLMNSSVCPSRKLSDKMYCTFFKHKLGLEAFMCADNTTCIPKVWVNDSMCSCPDCSDEPKTTTTSTTTTTTTLAGSTTSASEALVLNPEGNVTTTTIASGQSQGAGGSGSSSTAGSGGSNSNSKGNSGSSSQNIAPANVNSLWTTLMAMVALGILFTK